ncbi:MAG TPA: NEW3 domain-containing protein, partial [Armatimonadota bacterium]|nr:NEW3 domain-containing protein [Armatimonadota bacterium]
NPRITRGLTGTVRFASIALADEMGDDYVVDPGFDQWYEPVPEAMRERLASETGDLGAALASARDSALADLTGQATRNALLDVGARARSLREWIVAEKAENGCRRALRDIETVDTHLGYALLTSLGATSPSLQAASRAAPGDAVPVRMSLPDVGLPAQVNLSADLGATVKPERDGGVVTIPADTPVGSVVHVTAELLLGEGDRQAGVRLSHAIEVVPPLEITAQTVGGDVESGAFDVQATVRSNRAGPVKAQLSVQAPRGWQSPAAREIELQPGEPVTADLSVTPAAGAEAGSVPITVTVAAGADRASASLRHLHIPPEANLLRNPGFEDGPWTGGEQDTTVFHSGHASLRLSNPQPASSQASQTVTLNQERPTPILVRAASRAENVSGARSREYSLYVDIYYTDGTPLYGQTFSFETGTTDWQVGELIIEPEKPIRNVNVYRLLRGKWGTAWFDDVAVMEDPRRKGSIGREAAVTVDSLYSGYSEKPINNGIVHVPADAHWTEESWASADMPEDHSVALDFGDTRSITRVVIYWSLDAGIPRTSHEAQVQVPEGDGWRTVATARPTAPEEETWIELEQPLVTSRLRLLQPSGQGPEGRPNLMWVREVEVFVGE